MQQREAKESLGGGVKDQAARTEARRPPQPVGEPGERSGEQDVAGTDGRSLSTTRSACDTFTTMCPGRKGWALVGLGAVLLVGGLVLNGLVHDDRPGADAISTMLMADGPIFIGSAVLALAGLTSLRTGEPTQDQRGWLVTLIIGGSLMAAAIGWDFVNEMVAVESPTYSFFFLLGLVILVIALVALVIQERRGPRSDPVRIGLP